MNPTEQNLFNQLQKQKQTLDQKLKSNKAFIIFLVLALILIVWTSYSIINNPYSYPTRFWLYFMIGVVCLIVTLMIDNVTNLQLIKTFQAILILVGVVLNIILIVNVYTKLFAMPEKLINLIVLFNGFMSGYLVNFMLNYNVQEVSTLTATVNCPGVVVTPGVSSTPMPTTPAMTMTPRPMMQPQIMPMVPNPMMPQQMLPPQVRALDDNKGMEKYDFGAFNPTLSSFRSADGQEYFNDYEAQLEDMQEFQDGEDGYYEPEGSAGGYYGGDPNGGYY